MVADHKIKKSAERGMVDLEPTIDILAELRESAPDVVRVGFAAETTNVISNASEKLASKGLSMIIANDVSGNEGDVFGSDGNTVTIIRPEHEPIALPRLAKAAVAERILDEVRDILTSGSHAV